jgi:AbiJ-like protein
MAEQIVPSFSARNRGAQAQIDNACPETTRKGLLHLLYALVEKKYVEGWQELVGELKRIARSDPGEEKYPRQIAAELLKTIEWQKVFDFCERLYSHLAREVWSYGFNNDIEVIAPKSAVQEYIASELQRLFVEENLAFEFSSGLVQRRGRRHTANQVAAADLVLGDSRFFSARAHYKKAKKYFRNVAQPDYENVVKEAVCAVEAVAKVLFPDGGATLGDVVKSIAGNEWGRLPKAIAKTFDGLYGFRGSGEGVGHGGTECGAATKEIAEYALAVSASQIIFLVDFAKSLEEDIPF